MTERLHVAQSDATGIERAIQVRSDNPSAEYLGSHAGLVWLNTNDNKLYRESGGSAVALESDVDLSGYALVDHSHAGDYAALAHTHSQYADVSHSHAGYAADDHTHSQYADVSHSHSSGGVAILVERLGVGSSQEWTLDGRTVVTNYVPPANVTVHKIAVPLYVATPSTLAGVTGTAKIYSELSGPTLVATSDCWIKPGTGVKLDALVTDKWRWVEFFFSTPASLSGGQTYWIGVYCDGASGPNTFLFADSNYEVQEDTGSGFGQLVDNYTMGILVHGKF
jgi:hypothetical protein